MSFKVGDKVKTKKSLGYLGCEAIITGVQGDLYSLKWVDTGVDGSIKWNESELDHIKNYIPEFFDKATALKLAIDGYKITRESFGGFFVFNGVDFTSKYSSGYEEKASGILNYEDGWCLYKEPTPEPKFSKGDFVSTTSGKLGLIVAEPQYYNNKFLYSVRFNFLSKSNTTSRTTPELQLREADKELLKEASEEYSLSI